MIFGNFAAGSKRSKQIFNIANNGVSSSLLQLGSHKKIYKDIFLYIANRSRYSSL